ncbi:MAG TPA: hypothetical protein VM032_17565 [Vicinamibacterales bacterium]|nr:hypothetical protein [Vicinamibacterales bacterium]
MRLKATTATPAAPRFTHRILPPDAPTGDADGTRGGGWSVRGRCRRSSAGIHRDTYAKLSDVQTGHRAAA